MKRLLTLLLGLLLALSLAGCGTSRPQASASTGPAEGTLEVHFIDVGQADAALLLCGGETMLIDGGNVDDSDLIVSYLSGQGVERLDYVVCTHAHEDHVGGLAGALAAGVLFFCFQLIGKGNDWVGFFGTRYYDSGAIYDRNGVLLYDGQTKSYAENQATRVSTLHLVGDQNFGTSLRSVLASRLTGYNLVTGTSLGSHDVTLTIDAALNETAYAALNGRKGVVAVYDYTTGDLLCEGSSPSYDPNNPPSDINENPAYEGVYLNRFFSSTYPPGSVFKLVTTAAAIEQKKDLDQFRYTCTGSLEVDGDVITCPYAHGENMDIKQCLATSCNGAYATLAMELGGKTLGEYMEQAGLLDSLAEGDNSFR